MGIITTIASIATVAFAQTLVLDASPISSDTRLEHTIASAVSHATADFTGKGDVIQLRYTASSPVDTYILFLKRDGRFDPLDAIHVLLPTGTEQEVRISLAHMPAWTPITSDYRFHFLSENKAGATFHSVDFLEPSLGSLLQAGLKQSFGKVPYTPSSYHQIRGYRIFSVSLTLIAGLTLLIFAIVLFWKHKPETALGFIVTVVLLSQLRFSVDVLRFTRDHLQEWNTNQTYATAGATYAIADALRDENAERVHLCTDGTSYLPTLMRYAFYPIKLQEDDPTHIVVSRSLDSSFKNGKLRCKDLQFTVEEVTTFSDGSIIYRTP